MNKHNSEGYVYRVLDAAGNEIARTFVRETARQLKRKHAGTKILQYLVTAPIVVH